jgi:uncharacterized protein
MSKKRSYVYLLSILVLITAGHYLALQLGHNKQTAWIWVALYYGIWMLASILIFLSRKEIKELFSKGSFHFSLILPLLFATIALIEIFLPNTHIIKWDSLLLMNIIICFINPFIEEIYWRGIPPNVLESKWIQYITASVGFAASHPLVLGVNSRGASGWQTFAGAFILGSCWWFYYNKKKSLRWPVFTHFLIDFFGLAAYLLADKVALLM